MLCRIFSKAFRTYSKCITFLYTFFIRIGLRIEHFDRYSSDVAGSLGDWPRVHVCYPQAPANDHLRHRESFDPDLFELTRPNAPLGR